MTGGGLYRFVLRLGIAALLGTITALGIAGALSREAALWGAVAGLCLEGMATLLDADGRP